MLFSCTWQGRTVNGFLLLSQYCFGFDVQTEAMTRLDAEARWQRSSGRGQRADSGLTTTPPSQGQVSSRGASDAAIFWDVGGQLPARDGIEMRLTVVVK